MSRMTKSRIVFGFVFLSLMVCLSYLMAGEVKAQFSFSYTAPVTQKNGSTGNTTKFNSILTNTGSGTDTYNIDMIKKPPTPADWWIRFCSGGICWPPTVTHAELSLDPGQFDAIDLDIQPRTIGAGEVTMKITSQGNPSLSDSITFTLYASASAPLPVLNQWGLILLILLIISSGGFIMLRRLRLSKVA